MAEVDVDDALFVENQIYRNLRHHIVCQSKPIVHNTEEFSRLESVDLVMFEIVVPTWNKFIHRTNVFDKLGSVNNLIVCDCEILKHL